MKIQLSRREFLKAGAAVGGGLVLEFSVAGSALAQAKGAVPAEVTSRHLPRALMVPSELTDHC